MQRIKIYQERKKKGGGGEWGDIDVWEPAILVGLLSHLISFIALQLNYHLRTYVMSD